MPHQHQVTERDIALVIEECVCTLLDVGIDEEGLFKIQGTPAKVSFRSMFLNDA